jgi:hypothetical protein
MSAQQKIALKLRVLTHQGDFLGGTVDIELKHLKRSHRLEIRAADASREIVINGQPRLPKGDYQITVIPAFASAPETQVVSIPASSVVTVTVVSDHRREQKPKRNSALALNASVDNSFIVKGRVHGLDSSRLPNVTIQAFDRDLRSEEKLGEVQINNGHYEIRYAAEQFLSAEKDSADLVVKALAANGSLLVASPVVFNAPPLAEIDLTIPADALQPATLFGKIGQSLEPPLKGLKIEELEEDDKHQDLSFLAGETGFEKSVLARFVLADKLGQQAIQPEFWFGLLGGSFFKYAEDQSLEAQLAAILNSISSLDATAARKAIAVSFKLKEIPEILKEKAPVWVEEFLEFTAGRMVIDSDEPTFVKSALSHAGIEAIEKQKTFARLFNQYRTITPELIETLREDGAFNDVEIADLRVTFQLSNLTRADFSVVKMIKDEFDIRRPEEIRALAKLSQDEWVKLVRKKHDAGAIRIPFEAMKIAGQRQSFDERFEAEVFGKTLERRFREAFPTAAFAGGLERALNNGGAHGLRHAKALKDFLESHEEFELLNTPVDEFMNNGVDKGFWDLEDNEEFQLEIKAAQRVFKLAPTFEATDALLADGLHSAQQIYQTGESEFVRRYGDRPGFTPEIAQLAWNRAADTHAAVLTIVADLKALEADGLPLALTSGNDLSSFPNWDNLFQTGDFCDCDHCRSVLGPAAYFADLLMFLGKRNSVTAGQSVKDVLFKRRPDLGFLELNCDNALTTLPYIDVVCEVLEDVVAAGANDIEIGLANMPGEPEAAKAAVAAAFEAKEISLGADFSLSQVGTTDLWVVHGQAVTYLLKRNPLSINYFAEVLRNTKADAAELRAYPQYVNPKAYEELRQARYPFALPFDLFAEEAWAAFQKIGVRRWELMQVLRGTAAPNNPTDGEIAAEYFGISVGVPPSTGEAQIILNAALTNTAQQIFWGEAAIPGNLTNVKVFLRKAGLEFNELLALLDLKFINPAGDIFVDRPDPSCDTDKMLLQNLDAAKLDRIHRFLRLWRKLNGWKMWELDLVIHVIGAGQLTEDFLVQLMRFVEVKKSLGAGVTMEQTASLFGNLNIVTRFTGLHEKREDALYQNLFLNKKFINPLDPAFEIDPATNDLKTGQTITAHQAVIQSALGVREADLKVFRELKKSSGQPYITDELTLANLSFLYRHSWLAKTLKFKAEEWAVVLKLFKEDISDFADPQAAWEFLEKIGWLKNTGFKVDEINWLLAADRTAKAAVKESDAARFLTALRKELKAIQAELLGVTPPTDVDGLTALLTSLLQRLNRDEAETQFFIAVLRDEVSLQTKVAGLDPSFVDFPEVIKSAIRISYDRQTKTMRFIGLMTEVERTTLLTDPSLPAAIRNNLDYKVAIDELFRRPRLALKFFEPVFYTSLEMLPQAVDFNGHLPAALTLKISYDAEQRLLRFAGIMSKEEKEALDALSPDAGYRHAVNSLFKQPLSKDPPPEKTWLTDADLIFPLRDLNDPANDHLAENLATAVTDAIAYLLKASSESVVIQQASAQLGLTEALTRKLFTRYALFPDTLLAHLTEDFATTTGAIDYVTLQTTFDGWFWANRAAAILKKWNITLEELERLIALPAGAQLFDLLSLPLNATGAGAPIDKFLRTSRLFRLRDSLPETEITLLEVLGKLSGGVYADFAADMHRLNNAWLAADAEHIIISLDIAPAGYLLVESWERMVKAFRFLYDLNAGATTAQKFTAAAMTNYHARALKELLRSKFGAETWLSVSAEIQDALRERKRDALVAWLLAQPKPYDAPTGKWENSNDLYAYYLLDVEMGSCQLTSRLVQASGSIQLFVQRCFMGLEPDVVVEDGGDQGDSAWRWWKWMRKYRVWEANRKVFLWPENWIEPELKKDRSQFFKDLENELLQNEVNQQNVETALSNYLEKLDGVAQLEIAGFYQEDDGDETIIHLFGRTPGAEPHIYYYRRYDYRQWTPWEKVDLDIQGEYLIPAVVNKRLFLFWPIFTETPDENENGAIPLPLSNSSIYGPKKTVKRLRLQMAMSDYRQGKWTPKKVSKDFCESSSFNDFNIDRKFYHFIPIDRSALDGRFVILFGGHSYINDGVKRVVLDGRFELAGCSGELQLLGQWYDFNHVIQPEWASVGQDWNGSYTEFMKWIELGGEGIGNSVGRHDFPENDFTLDNPFFYSSESSRFTTVLDQTPWTFRMTPPWHQSYFDRLHFVTFSVGNDPTPVGNWLPFFYNDKKRTFFVLPSHWASQEGVKQYYPEIKKAYRQMEDYYEADIDEYVDNYDLSEMPVDERQQLEQEIRSAFSIEHQPPYTDEQFRVLWKRLRMWHQRQYMCTEALELFESRRFHFKNFYHPFVCDFAKLVRNPLKGIPALMSRETQLKNSGFSFNLNYQPTSSVVEAGTENHHPKEVVDFTPEGAYSPYNWELFFHTPLLIANTLSKNQRFEEARDWYHFIFNPIGVESAAPGGSPMSKYWITKPFFETTDPQYVQQRIDNILRLLAGDTTAPGYSAEAKKALEDQVIDWRNNPFEPHRIANYRTVAYQKTAVMKYLDNLIAWGDYLFRQDSTESINEATQLYILAAEILGPPPKKIPPRGKPPLESFNELEGQFDLFSNALTQVENLIPAMPGVGQYSGENAPLPMLYFNVPQNEKLLGYWDTVADRLYKIRHCMNIDGVARQLALFEPPIDPAALVKAVAQGADLSSALTDLNAPLPLYRFNAMLQKANEVCNDVKSLGVALLAALEKKDAEALGLLRQGQEIQLLEAVKALRERQVEETKENAEAIRRSRNTVEERRNFYRDIEKLSGGEKASLAAHMFGIYSEMGSTLLNAAAGSAHLAPEINIGVSGLGSPVITARFGGDNLGKSAFNWAAFFGGLGGASHSLANLMATQAGNERRWEDWKLQERLAEKELLQMDQQIAAAELRIAIAEKELENHNLQIENARAVDNFMRSKYTNEELYQWQVGQISGVYFQSYKLAYDLAKRAEKCFRFELGLQDSNYIQFGYWDSLKKGLLSGEKLQYDLSRLETAYMEQNRREFEMTKHISLALLDPLALVKLRETGRCFLRLPEEVFDLDFPGHYFRRIKSVSLTLPCVTGPYTTISCTLRLLKNSVRINTANGDNGYPRNTDDDGAPADDPRFIENNIPVKAIAASGGQNDSGVFELNFRDERYLPFEGAGAISEWSLELFNDQEFKDPTTNQPDFGRPLRQFDYGSISDAVLHIKYTAREDAGPFKNRAIAHLREYFSQDGATPSLRLFNLRQEFPTQWHRFLNPADPANGNVFELEMSPNLFSFRDKGKNLKVNKIWLLARCAGDGAYNVVMSNPPLPEPTPSDPDSNKFALAPSQQYGGLRFAEKEVEIEIAPTETPVKWRMTMTGPDSGGALQKDKVEDLLLVLGYEWESGDN